MRIDATQAHHKAVTGQALLVCAYDDEDRCREILLDGAITLAELESELTARPRDTEIIFYCA